MRQSIRALGWAITLSTIIFNIFLVLAFYSATMLFMTQGVQFNEYKKESTKDSVTLSIPITINNTGFFDINNFQIATSLKDSSGSVISEKSTVIQEVPRGQSMLTTHNYTLSFIDILSNMTYLLFNDTEFKIDFSIGFGYAHLLGFHMSMKNMSMPWGAPFYELKIVGINSIPINDTFCLIELQLTVENHSFLDATAILTLNIYNETGEHVGNGTGSIFVSQGQRFIKPKPLATQILVELTDPKHFTGRDYADVNLEIPGVLLPIRLGRIYYG